MALPDSPLTRGEQYLSAIAGQETALPNVPLTRTEQYLAKIAGQDVTIPNVPLTRQEQYLAYIAENGSGGGGSDVPTGISPAYITSLDADELRYSVLPENCFFAKLKTAGNYSLANSTGCKNLVLPVITSFGYYPVADMADLEKLDVGVSSPNFGGNYFASGCRKLNAIIIRKTSAVVTIANVNSLAATPFASNGTGGILYVPQSLISSYQSATNWSTILGYANNSIEAIEGSIYETQYADGTPIPTA